MPLKQVSYKDPEGRQKLVLLPEGESERNADMGVPLGPPDLAELGLPIDIEVKLNNELFHRGIITARDVLARRPEVLYAIQASLKLSAEKLVGIYLGKDYKNASSESTKEQSNKTLQHRRPRRPA